MQRRSVQRRDLLAGIAGVAGAAGVFGAFSTLSGDGRAPDYEPLGSVDLQGTRELVVGEDGTTAFVAVNDGIASVDVGDPATPSVLAERRDLLADRSGGPMHGIHDCAVDGDRLLAVGPAHSGAGEFSGAVLFDVADPADPRRIAVHEADHPIHNCEFVDGHAYLTGTDVQGTPLVVLAATGDDVREVGRWSLLEHEPAWSEVRRFRRPLHDVTVQDDLACLAHWDAGTYLLDVADPTAPQYLGHVRTHEPDGEGPTSDSVELPGNSHYAEVGDDGDVLAVGREAWTVLANDCIRGGPGGVDLYDVSDPTAIEHRATISPPPAHSNLRTDQFTTAHNLELTGDRLYSSWYFGGVKLHDVSEPGSPRELAWWRRPDTVAFWTARHSAGATVTASAAESLGLYPHGVTGRVYVFPDRAGRQPDPPSLTEPPADAGNWPEC